MKLPNDLKQFFRPKTFLLINLGLILTAIEVFYFKKPNGFAIGGVSGISIIIAEAIANTAAAEFFTMSMINLLLNGLLLVVGFAFLGRGFGLSTVYCSLVYSLEVVALEKLLPVETLCGWFGREGMKTLTDEPFFELIIVILMAGIGASLLFQNGASSGGTDILALILKKYSKLNIGRALLYVDFLITLCAFPLFGMEIGLLSFAGLFAKAFLVDGLIESMNVCKCFLIITSHPDKIEPYITSEMHRSATELDATGVYTQSKKYMIITVCRRVEAVKLKRQIKLVDPEAFLIVTNSNEIIGKGFGSI